MLYFICIGAKERGHFSSEQTMEEAQRFRFYDLDDNTDLFCIAENCSLYGSVLPS